MLGPASLITQALGDQPSSSRRAAPSGVVERCGVDLAAKLPAARCSSWLAICSIELAPRDVDARSPSPRVAAAGDARVGLDSPDGEGSSISARMTWTMRLFLLTNRT